ncbi:hypothetical protein [Kitasatospora sp. NPDC056184]|uniref:hypothetical protein n=1 Tax=Kitasatospora sp. NPDC056184 TaxID=3345738 RepID=UPI0035D91814
MISITAVVEGMSDEGAVLSILRECDFAPSMFQGKRGRAEVLKKLAAYNQAARLSPWFVLVDLDSDSCVVSSTKQWLPNPSEFMIFRVAVTELEAWLLADRQAIASFLGVAESTIPRNPDFLTDPKQDLINLARRSRKRDIREGLVPRPNSGTSIGPTYVSDIREFGRTMWRPRIAAEESPSLARCILRLDEFRQRLQG